MVFVTKSNTVIFWKKFGACMWKIYENYWEFYWKCNSLIWKFMLQLINRILRMVCNCVFSKILKSVAIMKIRKQSKWRLFMKNY